MVSRAPEPRSKSSRRVSAGHFCHPVRRFSAFPADRGGDWAGRRYPGTVDRSPRLSGAACSSSVPALRILRINWRPRSTRRPAWIRRTRRVRFQLARARSSSERPPGRVGALNRPLGSVPRHWQFRREPFARFPRGEAGVHGVPCRHADFQGLRGGAGASFRPASPPHPAQEVPAAPPPFRLERSWCENDPLQPGAVFTASRRSRPAGRRRDRREPPPFPRARARRNRP